MNIIAKLMLDIGNSRNVDYVQYPLPRTGNLDLNKYESFTLGNDRCVKFELSNKHYPILESFRVPANYSSESTTVISLEGSYKGYYANGELVDKEYEKQASKPTAKMSKCSSQSALSFQFVVNKAMKIIAEDYGVDVEELNVVFKVYTMLPPADCTDEEFSLLETVFRNTTGMKDVYNTENRDKNMQYTIDKVTVYPEGFAGYVACMYDTDTEPRKGYEEYVDMSILMIDIGAGTTDVLVMSEGEVVDVTRETFTVGGNDVRGKLRRILKQKYRYDRISDSQLEKCMKTGNIKDGGKVLDIVQDVMRAKDEVAYSLVDDIRNYLDTVDFSLRSIEGVLIIGGGSLAGDDETKIKSMSSAIVKNIKEYSPSIMELQLPNKERRGVVKKMSPRDLNIEGLLILAQLD